MSVTRTGGLAIAAGAAMLAQSATAVAPTASNIESRIISDLPEECGPPPFMARIADRCQRPRRGGAERPPGAPLAYILRFGARASSCRI